MSNTFKPGRVMIVALLLLFVAVTLQSVVALFKVEAATAVAPTPAPLTAPLYKETAGAPVDFQPVADINQRDLPSMPRNFITLNDQLYLAADDGIHGNELWAYNLVDGTYSLTMDIYPGSNNANPTDPAVLNGNLYFRANFSADDSGLWQYNPVSATMTLVVDFADNSYGASSMVTADNKLFFWVINQQTERELWVFNPATSSAQRIETFLSAVSSSANRFGEAAGKLFFNADKGEDGRELWSLDPVLLTVTQVADIYAGPSHSSPDAFTTLNDRLYFRADSSNTGWELWMHDPAVPTTTVVVDIDPGGADSYVNRLVPYAGKLYFSGSPNSVDGELWVHDPNTFSTTQITTFDARVYDIVGLNGKIYYGGYGPAGGRFLYAYDPAVPTITLAAQVRNPIRLTSLADQLYFMADEYPYGWELWRYDPAIPTATLAADVSAGLGDGLRPENEWLVAGGKLYFPGQEELWVHDPVSFTTSLAADINQTTLGSSPVPLAQLNGQLYFIANDGVYGPEIWTYDPAVPTITLLADIFPGPDGYYTPEMVELDGKLYFSSFDGYSWNGGRGVELWRYDPAVPTTTLVFDIHPSNHSFPKDLTVLNGRLYFTANDGVHGKELWMHDPSVPTTTLVMDVRPGNSSSDPTRLTVLDGKLYFRADYEAKLWVHDPAVPTTTRLVDVDPYPIWPDELTSFNNKLYFSAGNSTFDRRLWIYDPVVPTITLVADIYPGVALDDPAQFTIVDNKLYFVASNSMHQNELWMHDPAVPTTTQQTIIHPTGKGSLYDLTAFNGKLYFAADDGNHGLEPWLYDPATMTTTMIRDINVGSDAAFDMSAGYAGFTPLGNKLYFRADDGVHGTELWVYDSTEHMLTNFDLYPGSTASTPRYFTLLNDTVLFQARGEGIGAELWHSLPVVISEPEINLLGNGIAINDGDDTPQTADHTDFGITAVNSNTITHTFTISNSGDATLNLTGTPPVSVTGSSQFTVVQPPTTTLSAGRSTPFQIIYAPTLTGVHTTTVTIANNDNDEDPFTFVVQGERMAAVDNTVRLYLPLVGKPAGQSQ